jgi:hypothetical protein
MPVRAAQAGWIRAYELLERNAADLPSVVRYLSEIVRSGRFLGVVDASGRVRGKKKQGIGELMARPVGAGAGGEDGEAGEGVGGAAEADD